MNRILKLWSTAGSMWRQKNAKDDNNGTELVNLVDDVDVNTDDTSSGYSPDVNCWYCKDDFQIEVSKKSRMLRRIDAELEVIFDRSKNQEGEFDRALLHIVATSEDESEVQIFVNHLISRGANDFNYKSNGKTALHYAVKKHFKGVAAKLLEHNAQPLTRTNKRNILPLKSAINTKQDEMGALLLAYMPNKSVRELFIGKEDKEAEFSLHNLLGTDLQKTVLAVLDCMIDSGGTRDNIKVYYNVLEADEKGRPPDDKQFATDDKSPFQIIATTGNKNYVCHDTIRLLLQRKWKKYARKRFQLLSFLYIIMLFCITFSGIVAVMTPDPLQYDTPLQISRAVFEVASVCNALQTLISELNQLKIHQKDYFTDAFNWLDFSSAILILCIVPLRFTEHNAQWHVFAFAYLFWVIRIFKYAAVFRETGVYAQVLFRILGHDFIQFGATFLVILLAFSGAFLLSLRGDDDLDTHSETRTISVIFMLCFLLTCSVILVNILIAQLTDTYQNIQQDAQRGFEVNRAWIIARVELNTFFFRQDFRKKEYVGHEDILKNVLTKWDSSPNNETNKYIRDIWDSLVNQKMNPLTVQERLVRQENALKNIQKGLDRLIKLQTDQSQLNSNAASPVTFDLNTVSESEISENIDKQN